MKAAVIKGTFCGVLCWFTGLVMVIDAERHVK